MQAELKIFRDEESLLSYFEDNVLSRPTQVQSTLDQYLRRVEKRKANLKQAKIYKVQILDLDLCWRNIQESEKRILRRFIDLEPGQYYRCLRQEKTGKTRVVWYHHEEDLTDP